VSGWYREQRHVVACYYRTQNAHRGIGAEDVAAGGICLMRLLALSRRVAFQVSGGRAPRGVTQ